MGMLVGESAAKYAGKQLDFDVWQGDEDGKDWMRKLRTLAEGRDVDVMDFPVNKEAHCEAPGPIPEAKPAAQTINSYSRPPTSRQVDSDDDSLIGFVSSPSSSRAPSPTPSELAEIEADPTLRTGHPASSSKKDRVTRPVYLVNLGLLLRPAAGGLKSKAGEGQDEFERVEMALNFGAELIRRKRDYGTELGG